MQRMSIEIHSDEVQTQITEHQTQDREKPHLLEKVPYVELNVLLDIAEHTFTGESLYLGRGNSGLVIKVGEYALKIGFGYDFPDDIAERVTALVHPHKPSNRAVLHKRLTAHLLHHFTFEQQAAAHTLGHQTRPDLIDDQVAVITLKGQPCGLLTPLYTGTFMSVSDPRFGVPTSEIALLKKQGIIIDDFSLRENGVVLNNGERRIFDIDVSPSKLKEPLTQEVA